MTVNCDREIDEAKKNLAELEEQVFTKEEYRRHINEIRTRLDAAVKDARQGMITNEFVSQYIDKIFVTIEGDNLARVEIKIFTGANTEKFLQKLKKRAFDKHDCDGTLFVGHTGHTLKKMVESYENSLKTK
jgi:hypothetical protein